MCIHADPRPGRARASPGRRFNKGQLNTMAGGFLSRWQEHQERRIRKLILAHDGRSNERFVSTWNVRKIAGNRRSLILTSEAIYDATMTYGSCKRRTPLVTVRAITTSAVSGHFLIHIDGSYDALYVHRQARRTAASCARLPHTRAPLLCVAEKAGDLRGDPAGGCGLRPARDRGCRRGRRPDTTTCQVERLARPEL